MKTIFAVLAFIILSISDLTLSHGFAQTVFSFKDFIEIVETNHPIAYQADLKEQEGASYVQKAKGEFDPKLEGDIRQKYFKDEQYYSYLKSGLKIPTWYGITVEGGYKNNTGTRLNSESYTDFDGIWNAGLSVNLGKGLFIDQRRADFKQAKIIKNSTTLEKRIILNQLIFDASQAYLKWNKAYNKVAIYEKSLEKAEERLDNIINSVSLGDKPAIDTLKVQIQVQDRSLKLNQAQVELLNKRELLNTYLWQKGLVPLELDSSVSPFVNLESNALSTLSNISTLVDNHPQILMEINKIDISKVKYRLKKESLKPTVKLNYNAISSDLGGGVIGDYSVENYTWGGTFSYPIFLRKERANVKLTELKIKQQSAKMVSKKETIKYKIISVYNQLNALNEQQLIQEKAVNSYRQLLDAEQQLFDIGESTLFLINTRDQNLIDSEIKLIEVYFSYYFAEISMNYHKFQF